ncbi:sugar ABC transporter permease [Paenibacillus swuensis]|uniref:Sugar ABC transporter permease n=1 Tax=Paenibacillus swuensis TaxID=1178515 RepID=A0A172THI6_9BACL|nr:ABC transporter permease subunit [Paenibacillus swuensis]ANE46426.1 sugar ABC transporter permease [Paenibacillus swuensis]
MNNPSLVKSMDRQPVRNSALKKAKEQWRLLLILSVPVVWLFIFHYIPMLGLQLAFKDFYVMKGIWGSPWVGLKYFEQFFNSPSFGTIIRNTLIINAYTLIAGFLFPILLAVGLNELRSRWFKKAVQTVTYMPYFISTVVMVGLVMQVLDPRIGIINQIITWFGGESINFMGEASYFKSIYVWSEVWQVTGYSAIIYLAALSGIDPSLHEAATIDGASTVQKIWNVDLPGIRPTIVILFILSLGNVMNIGFEKIYLMQNSLNASSSEVIATWVYKVGLQASNFSFGTAIGLFNSIINLVILLAANAIARRTSDSSLW